MLRVRELPDGTYTFPGGTLVVNWEGQIVGGVSINTRRFYFKGTSLDDFEVKPKVYSPEILPPYRGFVIDDVVRVRLYEPTTYTLPIEHYIREWTKIHGIYYRIERLFKGIKLVPVSNTSVKYDNNVLRSEFGL